jgi:serine protease Do
MGMLGSQAVLLLALLGAEFGPPSEGLWVEAKRQRVQSARSELARVAKTALPTVVSISATQPVPESDPIQKLASSPQRALGAGFFIHPDGYILTSHHVIEDATEIKVGVNTEPDLIEHFPAKVVGSDELTDIALLKIEGLGPFPVLPLGSTSSVEIADWVVVIGNPFGMANSVSVGVVSHKERSGIAPNGKDGYFDYLQTDASINPGNSGGPVLDINGDVIAIASAVNVSGQGMGFAIPIEIAKEILPQLKAHGRVRHAWIGASVRNPAELRDRRARLEGVVVSDVLQGGPASKAGLQVGDLIVALGGSKVRRAELLRWRIASSPVGGLVELAVRRGDKALRIQVKLLQRPSEAAEPERPEHAAPVDCGGLRRPQCRAM